MKSPIVLIDGSALKSRFENTQGDRKVPLEDIRDLFITALKAFLKSTSAQDKGPFFVHKEGENNELIELFDTFKNDPEVQELLPPVAMSSDPEAQESLVNEVQFGTFVQGMLEPEARMLRNIDAELQNTREGRPGAQDHNFVWFTNSDGKTPEKEAFIAEIRKRPNIIVGNLGVSENLPTNEKEISKAVQEDFSAPHLITAYSPKQTETLFAQAKVVRAITDGAWPNAALSYSDREYSSKTEKKRLDEGLVGKELKNVFVVDLKVTADRENLEKLIRKVQEIEESQKGTEFEGRNLFLVVGKRDEIMSNLNLQDLLVLSPNIMPVDESAIESQLASLQSKYRIQSLLLPTNSEFYPNQSLLNPQRLSPTPSVMHDDKQRLSLQKIMDTLSLYDKRGDYDDRIAQEDKSPLDYLHFVAVEEKGRKQLELIKAVAPEIAKDPVFAELFDRDHKNMHRQETYAPAIRKDSGLVNFALLTKQFLSTKHNPDALNPDNAETRASIPQLARILSGVVTTAGASALISALVANLVGQQDTTLANQVAKAFPSLHFMQDNIALSGISIQSITARYRTAPEISEAVSQAFVDGQMAVTKALILNKQQYDPVLVDLGGVTAALAALNVLGKSDYMEVEPIIQTGSVVRQETTLKRQRPVDDTNDKNSKYTTAIASVGATLGAAIQFVATLDTASNPALRPLANAIIAAALLGTGRGIGASFDNEVSKKVVMDIEAAVIQHTKNSAELTKYLTNNLEALREGLEKVRGDQEAVPQPIGVGQDPFPLPIGEDWKPKEVIAPTQPYSVVVDKESYDKAELLQLKEFFNQFSNVDVQVVDHAADLVGMDIWNDANTVGAIVFTGRPEFMGKYAELSKSMDITTTVSFEQGKYPDLGILNYSNVVDFIEAQNRFVPTTDRDRDASGMFQSFRQEKLQRMENIIEGFIKEQSYGSLEGGSTKSVEGVLSQLLKETRGLITEKQHIEASIALGAAERTSNFASIPTDPELITPNAPKNEGWATFNEDVFPTPGTTMETPDEPLRTPQGYEPGVAEYKSEEGSVASEQLTGTAAQATTKEYISSHFEAAGILIEHVKAMISEQCPNFEVAVVGALESLERTSGNTKLRSVIGENLMQIKQQNAAIAEGTIENPENLPPTIIEDIKNLLAERVLVKFGNEHAHAIDGTEINREVKSILKHMLEFTPGIGRIPNNTIQMDIQAQHPLVLSSLAPAIDQTRYETISDFLKADKKVGAAIARMERAARSDISIGTMKDALKTGLSDYIYRLFETAYPNVKEHAEEFKQVIAAKTEDFLGQALDPSKTPTFSLDQFFNDANSLSRLIVNILRDENIGSGESDLANIVKNILAARTSLNEEMPLNSQKALLKQKEAIAKDLNTFIARLPQVYYREEILGGAKKFSKDRVEIDNSDQKYNAFGANLIGGMTGTLSLGLSIGSAVVPSSRALQTAGSVAGTLALTVAGLGANGLQIWKHLKNKEKNVKFDYEMTTATAVFGKIYEQALQKTGDAEIAVKTAVQMTRQIVLKSFLDAQGMDKFAAQQQRKVGATFAASLALSGLSVGASVLGATLYANDDEMQQQPSFGEVLSNVVSLTLHAASFSLSAKANYDAAVNSDAPVRSAGETLSQEMVLASRFLDSKAGADRIKTVCLALAADKYAQIDTREASLSERERAPEQVKHKNYKSELQKTRSKLVDVRARLKEPLLQNEEKAELQKQRKSFKLKKRYQKRGSEAIAKRVTAKAQNNNTLSEVEGQIWDADLSKPDAKDELYPQLADTSLKRLANDGQSRLGGFLKEFFQGKDHDVMSFTDFDGTTHNITTAYDEITGSATTKSVDALADGINAEAHRRYGGADGDLGFNSIVGITGSSARRAEKCFFYPLAHIDQEGDPAPTSTFVMVENGAAMIYPGQAPYEDRYKFLPPLDERIRAEIQEEVASIVEILDQELIAKYGEEIRDEKGRVSGIGVEPGKEHGMTFHFTNAKEMFTNDQAEIQRCYQQVIEVIERKKAQYPNTLKLFVEKRSPDWIELSSTPKTFAGKNIEKMMTDFFKIPTASLPRIITYGGDSGSDEDGFKVFKELTEKLNNKKREEVEQNGTAPEPYTQALTFRVLNQSPLITEREINHPESATHADFFILGGTDHYDTLISNTEKVHQLADVKQGLLEQGVLKNETLGVFDKEFNKNNSPVVLLDTQELTLYIRAEKFASPQKLTDLLQSFANMETPPKVVVADMSLDTIESLRGAIEYPGLLFVNEEGEQMVVRDQQGARLDQQCNDDPSYQSIRPFKTQNENHQASIFNPLEKRVNAVLNAIQRDAGKHKEIRSTTASGTAEALSEDRGEAMEQLETAIDKYLISNEINPMLAAFMGQGALGTQSQCSDTILHVRAPHVEDIHKQFSITTSSPSAGDLMTNPDAMPQRQWELNQKAFNKTVETHMQSRGTLGTEDFPNEEVHAMLRDLAIVPIPENNPSGEKVRSLSATERQATAKREMVKRGKKGKERKSRPLMK